MKFMYISGSRTVLVMSVVLLALMKREQSEIDTSGLGFGGRNWRRARVTQAGDTLVVHLLILTVCILQGC